MLRIIQSTNVAHAKSYFTTSDYYLGNEQELPGLWRGEGARRLGLYGEVQKDAWEALCDNLDPRQGQRLTARQRADRTVGWDVNFHVPKGVSLLYAATGDERILNAFRDSVRETMEDMEAEMQTRVRKEGKDENRRTGNMVYGEFIHFTSRPVDEIPDPLLHAHCYVQNLTHDRKERQWKAGNFRNLKQDAPYFEAVYLSRLAQRLSELGLPIAADPKSDKGWELAGIDRTFIDRFSRRTQQIEKKVRELGIESPAAKAQIGARTREHKKKDLSFGELQNIWKERMTPKERQVLDSLSRRIGGSSSPMDAGAAAKAVAHVIQHEFERKSVVPERTLLAHALQRSAGRATVEQVERVANGADLIIGRHGDRRMVTTRRVLDEERTLLAFARKGRGTSAPIARKLKEIPGDELNADQKRAVKRILESRDRHLLLRGKAGVGKTRLLVTAKSYIEGAGFKVLSFAPSSDASRGVLRKEGFKDAETVAMLLKDPRLQQKATGNFLLIDEAGQMGIKTLNQVFELAERIDARVLLSGDVSQHSSVERGEALRLLEEEAGLRPMDVKEIVRQQGAYKEAVKKISEGWITKGFKQLEEMGWIVEAPGEGRHRRIAADYVEALKAGKSVLAISPSHQEKDQLTKQIRDRLRQEGLLGKRERSFRTLVNSHLTDAQRRDEENYVPGRDVLVFHQNVRGHKRGSRVEVQGQTLPLEHSTHFAVHRVGQLSLSAGDQVRITRNGFSKEGKRLDNGSLYRVKSFDKAGNIILKNGWTIDKDFGFLDHGHVVTSFGSQGQTVKRVFVAQSFESLPASSQRQFYVSASRATEKVIFYTGNKEEMLRAITKADERPTAMDLIGDRLKEVALRQNQRAYATEPPRARERELEREPSFDR